MQPRLVLATVLATLTLVSTSVAQTLTQPSPKPQPSPPTVTTKSQSAGHVKACAGYGAGFMNIPGTDTCIKVGGAVTVEAGH